MYGMWVMCGRFQLALEIMSCIVVSLGIQHLVLLDV